MAASQPADWANYFAQRLRLPIGTATTLNTNLSKTLQADVLLQVDGPEPYILHIELQASHKLGIPLRMLHYNVATRVRYGLPVVSVVALLKRSAVASDLTGRFDGSVAGRQLLFDYNVLRVWEESADTLLALPGLAPLALTTQESVADLMDVLRRFEARLQRPDVPVTMKANLLLFGFTLSGLQHDPAYVRTQYGELIMGLLEESSTAQWLRDKWLAEGQAKLIRVLGTQKFGPPSDSIVHQLIAIDDLSRWERIAIHLTTATDWNDLLATP